MPITNKLSNLDVQLISIIQDDLEPANGKPAILKDKNACDYR